MRFRESRKFGEQTAEAIDWDHVNRFHRIVSKISHDGFVQRGIKPDASVFPVLPSDNAAQADVALSFEVEPISLAYLAISHLHHAAMGRHVIEHASKRVTIRPAFHCAIRIQSLTVAIIHIMALISTEVYARLVNFR